MIVDTLDHAAHYRNLLPRLGVALDFIAATDLAALPDGRLAIDGDAVYAILDSYETFREETRRYECHRRYIDVQYMLVGIESCAVADIRTCGSPEPYDRERDLQFFAAPPKHPVMIALRSGLFAVLFPHDAHRPACALDTPARVRKCVVKVAV